MTRALAILLLLSGCSTPAPRDESRPNIVFILADDLGTGDVGCTGAPDIRTPSIDRLAAEGVRFTRFYSNGPECTPTRTALLTGRYQHRVGGLECAIGSGNVGRYDDAIRLRERDDLGLPASETSLARLLRAAGYATAAIGKWHLGYERKFFPDAHGFDEWFGPLGGGVDYFHHTEPDGKLMLYRNGEPSRREGYLTDLITEEAVAYIRKARSKPFFLYVPYTAPHLPGQGPNDRPEKPLEQQGWNKSNRPTHAAMVERMDRGIGEILRALDASNTLVIFTSDNGATGPGSNGSLSGKKGTLWEGGIRVPCIARWPGVLPAGATSDQVALTMDLTVSLVRAAGAKPDRPFDGIDVLAVQATPAPRTVFWRARRGPETWRAARQGDLKYLSHDVKDRGTEEHLFDLSADPGEKSDLLASRRTDVARLKELLRGWEVEVRSTR